MIDVAIIGGGPGGSALGCYLSKAGISNAIFEGGMHPRPHVGESLVTSTTRVFEDIGFLETMEAEGFVRKYGAAWHAPNGREFSTEFREFPQLGINQEYTYHVERSRFDLLLLQHARALGTKVYQGTHIKKVLFEDGHASGVRMSIAGEEIDIPAKMVVDASGRHTLLGNQLKLKIKDPNFNQYAVHAWFEDFDRGNLHSAEFIHIYFLPVERGWVWRIPISDTITSVGVVTEKETFKGSRLDVEKYFFKYANTNVGLANGLKNARRINDFESVGDYSYSMKKLVGDNYMLIGDAARFVDPIFSSGISVALYSAKFAATSIIRAFETNDFSEAALRPYQERLASGSKIWYEFIRLYYKLLPLFTHFIQSKEHRLEVLQLLQGEVFDRKEVPVLDAMRAYIKKVEESDSHIFKDQLTSIPLD